MKIVTIALAAALLLAANFAPAYAAEEGGDKGRAPPEFEYYQVPPLMVPVITEKGLTQQVSLSIQIETPFGKKEDLAAYGPRLVDAYLRDLYGSLGKGQLMNGRAVDIDNLKSRLTDVTQKILGKDNDKLLHGVLLESVQQHQML